MSKEISKPLSIIKETCGDCTLRKDCLFGSPVMQVMDRPRRNNETALDQETYKRTAISYIYIHSVEKIPANCPNPRLISSTVKSLGPKQSYNPKRGS